MQIRVVPTYADLSQQAAQLVAEHLRRHPDAVLGMPTGTTPEGFYAALVGTGVSFARAQTFNLDEYRGLPREHPQSFYSYMKAHLYDRVGRPPAPPHNPAGTAGFGGADVAAAEAALAAAGGLDLVVLGLGENGHIGFNEPGTPWNSRTHLATLTEATRRANARFFGSLGAVPHQAISMGVATILGARRVLLLAAGGRKQAVVRRLLSGAPDPTLPAAALWGHPDATVLLDAEAAAGSEIPPGWILSPRTS